jgi:hypothetical protein
MLSSPFRPRGTTQIPDAPCPYDLGRPHLDEATAHRLVEGLAAGGGSGIEELAARRDELLTAVVAATHGRRTGDVAAPRPPGAGG